MEAIALYAYEASSDLAAERGTYPSYAGSKWDRGLLPQDTLDLLEHERGEPVDVPRGGRLDWDAAAGEDRGAGHAQLERARDRADRDDLEHHGHLALHRAALQEPLRQVEPLRRVRRAQPATSSATSSTRGLWSRELADQIKYFDGDLSEIAAIPAELKERYRTAFQIDPRALIDAAARRQKWIDQSQSLNLFLAEPDMKALSHMYRHAWHTGLKTTYYLRTLGASTIEKATVQAAAAAAAPCRRRRRPPARSRQPLAARIARHASDGIGKASGMTEHAHPQAQQTKETLGVFRGSLMPTSRRFPWPAFFTI